MTMEAKLLQVPKQRLGIFLMLLGSVADSKL